MGFSLQLRRSLAVSVLGLSALLGPTVRAEPAGPEKRTVLVVGGGYGGLEAASQLAREGSTRVVLVDREAANARITHLPGYVAFGENIETPFHEHASADGFEFQQGEVTRWDGTGKQVQLRDGRTLRYDAIIMAVGARAATPASIEGLAQHAFGLRTLDEARSLRTALQARLTAASATGRRLKIMIAGGGPSGIELAGALARALPESASIQLLQRGDRLKPFGDSTTEAEAHRTARWLRKLGIKIATRSSPMRIDATSVALAPATPGGRSRRLKADLLVATLGDAGAAARLGPQTNGQARIEVDEFLRRGDLPDAFVIGDAAAIVDSATGKPVAQGSKKAQRQGELAASNALRALRSEALVAYRDASKPTASVPGAVTLPRIETFLAKHVGRAPLSSPPPAGARALSSHGR